MRQKHNGGFTLVELVIAMATGTLVFIAASALLLLGLRINNMTTGTTIRANTTRILMTLVERMATEGTITEIRYDDDGSWEVVNQSQVAFSYDHKQGAIFIGKSFQFETIIDGNPAMVNVSQSDINIDENGMLTLEITNEEGTYKSTIYCRTHQTDKYQEKDDPEQSDLTARNEFIQVLSSQYRLKGGGVNYGVVVTPEGRSAGTYASWYNPSWANDTAWCGCYVSWCLNQMTLKGYLPAPEDDAHKDRWYAYVAETTVTDLNNNKVTYKGLQNYFTDTGSPGTWMYRVNEGLTYEPKPGDLVFFNNDPDNAADHVGVVLSVYEEENNSGRKYISVIEGNVKVSESESIIAIRYYWLTDTAIIGYGILPWNPT